MARSIEEISEYTNAIRLPLKLKLDSIYFNSTDPDIYSLITLTATSDLQPQTLYLPSTSTSGVLKNDGTGHLYWGSSDFADAIINVDYTSSTRDAIMNINQLGTGDSAMHFSTPGADFTIGIDSTDPTYFKIAQGTTLGGIEVFKVGASGFQFTNLELPVTLKTGTQGVITVGNSKIYNLESSRNLFIGLNSGNLTYTGASSNTLIGYDSMPGITTGSNNVVVGSGLTAGTSASNSIAIGYDALELNTIGTNNIAIGNNALYTNISNNNTAIGLNALQLVTTTDNVAVGYNAGNILTSGTQNTLIGSDADASTATINNSSAIGYGATVNKTNKAQLGNALVAYLGVGPVEITSTQLMQISNIGGTISTAQWGYLSALDQDVSTTADVNFNTLTTASGPNELGGNTTISGNLVVTGSIVTVVEILEVLDAVLYLNNDEIGPGVAFGYSGLEINRGTLTNYRIIYDETLDTLIIGFVGSLQAVATREDTPTDGAIPIWDAATQSFLTASGLTAAEATQLKNIDANVIEGKRWEFLAQSLTYSSGDIAIGTGARDNSTNGAHNISIGDGALGVSTTTDITGCIAIGKDALGAINATGGTRNIAIGYEAGSALLANADNIFIGYQAGASTILAQNILIGNSTNTNADATENVIIGHNATCMPVNSDEAVIIGAAASIVHPNAGNSVVIGAGSSISGVAITDTSYTILLGSDIVVEPTASKQIYTYTGLATVAIGLPLIYNNATGQFGSSTTLSIDGDGFIIGSDSWLTNQVLYLGEKTPSADYGHGLRWSTSWGSVALDGAVLFGYTGGLLGTTNTSDKVTMKWDDAQLATFYGNVTMSNANTGGTVGVLSMGTTRLFSPAAATSSLYIGQNAGRLASTGGNNIGVGNLALSALTTGINNIGMGYHSGRYLTTGSDNILIGFNAGTAMVGAQYNVAIGFESQEASTGGVDNISIGRESLNKIVTGTQNVAYGAYTLLETLSDRNTAIGHLAGTLTSTGTDNTFIGYNAGSTCTTGSNNLAVGSGALVGAAAARRSAIGYGASSLVDDGMVLGDSSVKVGIRTSSPAEALDVAGNIAVSGTVDGADIGAWKTDYDSKVDQDVRSGAAPSFINMTDMVMSGLASWGGAGSYWSMALPNFTLLRGGNGYVKSAAVTFAGSQIVTVTANVANYIYVNSSGVLQITSSGSSTLYQNNIVLFQVFYDGTAYIVKNEAHPYNFQSIVSSYLHNNVGTVVRGTGADIEASATSGKLKITGSDVMEDHGLQTTILTADPVTVNYVYINGSTQWIINTTTDTVPLLYSSAGTPTAISLNQYGIMIIYVTGSSLNSSSPTYLGVMQTSSYSTQASAEAAVSGGGLVYPDAELAAALEPCKLAYVIVQNVTGSPVISSVIIQKDTLIQSNSGATGGGSGGDHLLLTNLNGGQYTDGGHSFLGQIHSAAAAPISTDDTASYKNNTSWLDTATADIYLCVDNSASAAIWKRVAWSNLDEVKIGISATATSYGVSIGTSAKTLADGISIGRLAGSGLTSGTGQVAIGYQAADSVTTGIGGVFIGYDVDGLAGGSYQTVIGNISESLGAYSVVLGYGAKAYIDGVSIGQAAGEAVTTGTGAIYIGYDAGSRYTTGANICIGYNSGYTATASLFTSADCLLIGKNCGNYITGNENVFVGGSAGSAVNYRITSGIGNAGLGHLAGCGDGDNYNVALGYQARTDGGNSNVAVGYQTLANGGGTVAIGNGAACSGADAVAVGNSVSAAAGEVVIGGTSIKSYKLNGINKYVTPAYTVSSVGPVDPGIKIIFPANVAPWHAEVIVMVSDASNNLTHTASTRFNCTGGHDTSGAGAAITIGSVTLTGFATAQFETVTPDSAVQLTVKKTTNFPTRGNYSVKVAAEVSFGQMSQIRNFQTDAVLITF